MKIAVIGLGLIGGSMAKAIKAKTSHTVIGFDRSNETVAEALNSGAIDESRDRDFSDVDLLLIALYPSDTVSFMESYAHELRTGCVVVDMCGVKRYVCERAKDIFKASHAVFIGGHPMAGREVSGFSNATPELFKASSMILTPDDDIQKSTLDFVSSFFTEIGFGRITVTTPAHHDEVIAYTSQLAHVVSSAYVKSPMADEFMGFSAGSFKDLTRVARLNEDMWTELFLCNPDYLGGQLGVIIENLIRFRDAIVKGDRAGLLDMLREGSLKKQKLEENT